MEYKYIVYGLKVKSDLEISSLEKLLGDFDKCDVEVKSCKIENKEKARIKKDTWFSYEYDSFCFKVEGLGYYLIRGGNQILIDKENGFKEHDLSAFLLGTSLGVILIQRNDIAMHGACTVIENKAIILTGKSGVGKSTLASSFVKENYKFLSDDISRVILEKEKVYVAPAYPEQKLCEDTLQKVNLNKENLELINEDRKKYKIKCDESFVEEAKELIAIVELVPSEVTQLEEVLGEEKLKIIIKNIYRIEIIGGYGIAQEYFKKILELATKIKVYKLYKSTKDFNLDLQRECIFKIIK